MPQVSTPRTTRNSRGLRQSPGVSSADSCLGDSSRVSKRLRQASPATPTPSARVARFAARPNQSLALEAILEEQSQPQTPTQAATRSAAVTRPSIIPPPVTLAPATPSFFTPPQRNSSLFLEHRRVSSIRSTAIQSAKGPFPRTPIRYPARHTLKFVEVTPKPSQSRARGSPGFETRRFRQRRDEEGEEAFARELWIAIRNDHYMRDCWCGPPNIYNSKQEAEAAVGHLRFYVVGSETKNLRVLQRKNDFGWHCSCGNTGYHPVYQDLINNNGKRPAETSEIDLIAQDHGSETNQIVDRVVPALSEQISDHDEEGPQPPTQPKARQSMWAQACGILIRAVSTMGSPVMNLLGKLRELPTVAYDILDVRRKDTESEAIIVKRLKRLAPASPISNEQPTGDDAEDGFEDIVWADEPTKRIGFCQLQNLLDILAGQLNSINTGRVVGGSTLSDIHLQIKDGEDLSTSIALHQFQEQKYGPMTDEEPEDERAEKLLDVLATYKKSLERGIDFIQHVYDYNLFQGLKQMYHKPPRVLPLGNIWFRQDAMLVGKFLCFLRSLDSVSPIKAATLETICKVIVDVNAIHKQQLAPSFVALKSDSTEDMPGSFPEERISPLEDIPADELTIQPLYDFKYPSPEPEEAPGRPGDYKMIEKPKGILKPSTNWAEPPPSPTYVATPEKKRKLAFKSPLLKFVPPSNIPTKVMTPEEAEQLVQARLRAEALRDERSKRMFEAKRIVSRQRDSTLSFKDKWDLEELEKDEREMGLSYHARKYDGFLSGVQDDMEKRAEQDKENRFKTELHLTPRIRMVRVPAPPVPSTPIIRRRLEHVQRIDAGSPGTSSPVLNVKSVEVEEPSQTVLKKKPAPRSIEEFFAQDDDDLAISTTKLEQLQIDRQIREEFEVGVQRELEEKKKREEEEARAAEERRIKEELRQKEEARRREREAQKQKEAEEFAALTGLRPPTRRLIRDLNDDWDCKVDNAARANPNTELVKTLEGQPLTRRDFEEKLLPPTAWLNDNVIIGSILHVANYINMAKGATDQEPKCAAFTSYFWPRLLSHGPSQCGRLLRRAGVRKNNFFNIDTILIPICAQSHWTLAVIRPQKRTVAHLDSMRAGRGDTAVKNKLLELVHFILDDQFVESEWQAIDYEGPRQTNGWDCGVFAITNAMCLALGLNPKLAYTERELTQQRRVLAAVLLNEGFKGEFTLDGL